jgi:GDPmannose 4,6-dehydratase
MMWRMLQHPTPEDFVVATGKTYTVEHFIERAALHIGMEIEWEGEGVHEKRIDRKSGKTIVSIDPRYFRPAEVELLVGDASKAKELLGWEAQTDLEELIAIMMRYDLADAKYKASKIS